MPSPLPSSGLRTLARIGILITVFAGCSSESSGEQSASLDAALRDDASRGVADDASPTPDDESDANTAQDPDAGGDELAPGDAATSDTAIDGDGSEQTDDDASTPDATAPDDSGGSDEDAQTADAGPTCDQNLADCNGDDADGCEVDTTSSAQHCSGCGQACSLSNAVPTCVASSCAVASCVPSFGNCNGDPTDGCEVNINTDTRHCGGCGLACTLPNAIPGCTAQRCTIANCSPGFRDCDFSASNGCEIDTRSNRQHCGACNLPCAAGLQCVQSTCVP